MSVEEAASVTGQKACSLDEWFSSNGYKVDTFSNLGGSGWATQSRYKTEGGAEFFVKTARKSAAKMFAGEALGLQAMYATGALRIPRVFACNDDGRGGSYIVMEYLPLGGSGDQAALGRAMGRMHLAEPEADEARRGLFGFAVDNTIGGTPQPNRWDEDWVRFFREQRIGHQLQLASNSECDRLWAQVLERTDGLRTLFEGVQVKPCTLHGDLWSGNIATAEGRPCIFDPATYYGHHEAEWGMSWCAGFGASFWAGYRELIPEDPGFRRRAALYELYHQLNHYNLFGGSYLGTATRLLSRLTQSDA